MARWHKRKKSQLKIAETGKTSGLKRLPWGLAAGVLTDALIADPGGKYHPVALFGRLANQIEKYTYQDSRKAGIAFVGASVLPPVLCATLCARRFPQTTLAITLAASLGGTTLERIGRNVAQDLAKDPEQARQWIPWLCSRDPAALDAPAMARATVESLAENSADAAVASLYWALWGAPAVVLHRCVNTLDAMVGYHNERYENFGWAAARLDDALAYVPARLTAVLHSIAAVYRGKVADLPLAWKQAQAHPSPNAGLVEATAATALGVRLGGTTVYPHGIEQRPQLGNPENPAPQIETIGQVLSLERAVRIATAGLVGLALWCKAK